MTNTAWLTVAGVLIVAIGSLLLYLASSNQRLLARQPASTPMLIAALVGLLAGTAAMIAAWGGLVGGLFALCVWMLVSIVLPYVAAYRSAS